MRIGHASEVYIWLSHKLLCKIYIRDTLNYLNSRCNTAKLLWVVIYVVCYGWFSPDLVVINICRQRLIKVDRPLWQRSLANENAVVCRQGAMRWRLVWNMGGQHFQKTAFPQSQWLTKFRMNSQTLVHFLCTSDDFQTLINSFLADIAVLDRSVENLQWTKL